MSNHTGDSGKEKLPFKKQKPQNQTLGGRPSASTCWIERGRERGRYTVITMITLTTAIIIEI